MNPFVTIERFPYEEPYHVNLIVSASNGTQAGSLEIYTSPEQLENIGSQLMEFPSSFDHVILWEIGSERPEVRFGFYFYFRAFVINLRTAALHLRFSNNSELPEKAISEFCIETEPASLNRLGHLLREFSLLKHEYLAWTPEEGALHANRKAAAGSIAT